MFVQIVITYKHYFKQRFVNSFQCSQLIIFTWLIFIFFYQSNYKHFQRPLCNVKSIILLIVDHIYYILLLSF